MMTYVIKKYPEFLNTKVQSDLKLGLTFLLSETQILPQDSLEEVDTKLSLKKAIAHLTLALYNYYVSKTVKIPEYILKWETLCLDKNEFSEIRIVWEDKY